MFIPSAYQCLNNPEHRVEPKNQPWCDGSHARTQDEAPGKLYFYENGSRQEVAEP